MISLRQSKNYAKYMRLTGWIVEKINGVYLYIRKIPLTPFSIIKVQRPKKIPFEKIKQLAKKHHAIVVYLEPLEHPKAKNTSDLPAGKVGVKPKPSHSPRRWRKKEILTQHGYRLSNSPFLPTKTIHLDLTQSENEILAQMKKDGRYSIRKAEKEDIKIQRGTEIKRFHWAWKKSAGWQRYIPSLKSLKSLKNAFGENVIFLIAGKHLRGETKQKLLAGTIIIITNSTAYYYYAFTSKEGRRKLAQYLLVWEAIKLAKKQGCKIFDFEGIYDERFPIKFWQGFSHFKRSFGGKEIEYPGCFVKYCFL